jgi:hypothetical protein
MVSEPPTGNKVDDRAVRHAGNIALAAFIPEKNYAERAVVLAHRPDIAPAQADDPWY